MELNYRPVLVVETGNLDNDVWLRYRKKGIGGSDVASIMGDSHFRNIVELWEDKINPEPEEEELTVKREFKFALGHAAEEPIRRAFERKTGYKVKNIQKMYRHPLYPFMLADVDGLVLIEYTDGKKSEKAILEIKTTEPERLWEWDNDRIPKDYVWQGRQYMSVCNCNKVFFCCCYGFSTDKMIFRELNRDYAIEEYMIEEEAKFWKSVETRTKPELPSGQKLKQLEKDCSKNLSDDGFDDKEEIDLRPAASLFESYFAYQKQIDEQKKKIDEISTKQDDIKVSLLETLKNNNADKGIAGNYSIEIVRSEARNVDYNTLYLLDKNLYEKVVNTTSKTSIKIKAKKQK